MPIYICWQSVGANLPLPDVFIEFVSHVYGIRQRFLSSLSDVSPESVGHMHLSDIFLSNLSDVFIESAPHLLDVFIEFVSHVYGIRQTYLSSQTYLLSLSDVSNAPVSIKSVNRVCIASVRCFYRVCQS
jgi:hypothetical protein